MEPYAWRWENGRTRRSSAPGNSNAAWKLCSICRNPPPCAILNEHGVPPCEDGNLIIKRLISSTANRQFLNDSPCTLIC
ncbi:MAG: hypothetical protein ACLT38_08085 [Akkermansia sp.]